MKFYSVEMPVESKPRYLDKYRELFKAFYDDVFLFLKYHTNFFSDCDYAELYIESMLRAKGTGNIYTHVEDPENKKIGLPCAFANGFTWILDNKINRYSDLFNAGKHGIENIKEFEGINVEVIKRFELRLRKLERLYKKWEKKTIFVILSEKERGNYWKDPDYMPVFLFQREAPRLGKLLFALNRDQFLTFQELRKVVAIPPFDAQLVRFIDDNFFYKKWLSLAVEGRISFDKEELMRYCVELFQACPQAWLEQAFVNKCSSYPYMEEEIKSFRRSVFFSFCKEYKYPIGRIFNGFYSDFGDKPVYSGVEEWGCSKRFLRELVSEALGQWVPEAEEKM